jgi:hypothetical protein
MPVGTFNRFRPLPAVPFPKYEIPVTFQYFPLKPKIDEQKPRIFSIELKNIFVCITYMDLPMEL